MEIKPLFGHGWLTTTEIYQSLSRRPIQGFQNKWQAAARFDLGYGRGPS